MPIRRGSNHGQTLREKVQAAIDKGFTKAVDANIKQQLKAIREIQDGLEAHTECKDFF